MGSGGTRRARRAFAGVALITVSVAVAVGVARAASPGGNGRIAFVRSADQTTIWTADPGNGRERPLGRGLAYEVEPQWSPDGRRLLFTSFRGIYVVNSDGTHLRLVAPHGRQGSWSPDGRRIVYRGSLGYATCFDLFVLTLRTGKTTRYTRTPVCETHPRWSPDGRNIAFNVNRRDGPTSIVIAPAADSTRRQTLSASPGAHDANWSPDSSSLVFAVNGESIEIRSVAGQLTRTIQIYDAAEQYPKSLGDGDAVDFSPDGSSLVYTLHERSDITAKYEDVLYTSSIDGSAAKPLTGRISEANATWQPRP